MPTDLVSLLDCLGAVAGLIAIVWVILLVWQTKARNWDTIRIGSLPWWMYGMGAVMFLFIAICQVGHERWGYLVLFAALTALELIFMVLVIRRRKMPPSANESGNVT